MVPLHCGVLFLFFELVPSCCRGDPLSRNMAQNPPPPLTQFFFGPFRLVPFVFVSDARRSFFSVFGGTSRFPSTPDYFHAVPFGFFCSLAVSYDWENRVLCRYALFDHPAFTPIFYSGSNTRPFPQGSIQGRPFFHNTPFNCDLRSTVLPVFGEPPCFMDRVHHYEVHVFFDEPHPPPPPMLKVLTLLFHFTKRIICDCKLYISLPYLLFFLTGGSGELV